MWLNPPKPKLPTREEALPGREEPLSVPELHAVLGTPLQGAFEGYDMAMVGLGCFWGAERLFWTLEGVHSTAVGYAAGFTPNPTYREVCSGRTGHNEVVRVVFDSSRLTYEHLLRRFWEGHDPTQGMRQGNDSGTQYRSGIYAYTPQQLKLAGGSRDAFEPRLLEAGLGPITTEIIEAPAFYFAEDYHQQYLHKNPGGYCGLGGTGVSCPVGTGAYSDSE